MKRIIRLAAFAVALCVALASLAALLCACKGDEKSGGAVMTLGEKTIDEGTYRFLYATYKARYLARYSDASDSAAFWSAGREDGLTNAAWMDSLIRDSIRMQLVAEHLYDSSGLTLDENTENSVDEYISDVKNERFEGDDDLFASALAAFGTNEAGFRAALLSGEKMSALYKHYFGSGGVRPVTDEERAAYYRENYVRFAQINVNDAYAYRERDGHYVQNADGSYETRELTKDELAGKKRAIEEIESRLAAGETVEGMYSDRSENTDYPHGYYFTAQNAAKYDEKIVSAALGLSVGEWTKVTTEHGTFFIERLSLDEGGFALAENADFFGDFESSLKDSLFDDLLRSYFTKIAEDAERVNALSVTAIEPNYDLD